MCEDCLCIQLMKKEIKMPDNMLTFKANKKGGVAPKGRPNKVTSRFEKGSDYSDSDEDSVVEEYPSPSRPGRQNDEGSDIDEEAKDMINEQMMQNLKNENNGKDSRYIDSDNESDNDYKDNKEQSSNKESSSASSSSGSVSSSNSCSSNFSNKNSNDDKGVNKDITKGVSTDRIEGGNKDIS
jgi:hypothetical protein